MKLIFRRNILYFLLIITMSVSFCGCNKDANASEDATNEATDDSNANEDTEPTNADNSGEQETPDNEQAASGASAEPAKTAIAERSPVEITRIEVPKEQNTDDVEDATEPEPEKHEVTPDRFPVDKCQVEVNGLYQVKLAKDLLKEVNKRRADRKLTALTENQSLQACADARCKEQTYFIGHFRPDGSAFDSVGKGYVQGECIAVDYRSVNDIMEAWFSVNESRYQIMNPDYTQCGISIYDIDGTYYIAAEFGY